MRPWDRFLIGVGIVTSCAACGFLLLHFPAPREPARNASLKGRALSSRFVLTNDFQPVICDESGAMPPELNAEDRREILTVLGHIHGLERHVISMATSSSNDVREARVRVSNAMVFLKKTPNGAWELEKALEVRF